MKKHIPGISFSYCLLFTAYCLLFFTGCAKNETKAVADKKVNVQVYAAEKKQLRPSVETIGSLNANDEVIVSSEVDGIIKNIMTNEGTPVSKGTLLALIDDMDYSLDLSRSEAGLKQAEAGFENTRLEYKRKEALYKEELITQQQFEDVSARLAISGAEVERAKSTLLLARQRLSKTKIYSPISGIVNEKKAAAGDYARNGTPLFKVIQTNPLKLDFTVTEKDAGRIKAGQEVVFTVDAYPEREFNGKVSIVYPSLDEKTRTLKIEALAPNAAGALKPGLFTKVMLFTGAPRDTIVIPVTSLLYEGEKVRVFIAEGDTAKERLVRIGQKYSVKSAGGSQQPVVKEYTEIIEGLREGDRVITVGQQNLSDGVKVNVAR